MSSWPLLIIEVWDGRAGKSWKHGPCYFVQPSFAETKGNNFWLKTIFSLFFFFPARICRSRNFPASNLRFLLQVFTILSLRRRDLKGLRLSSKLSLLCIEYLRRNTQGQGLKLKRCLGTFRARSRQHNQDLRLNRAQHRVVGPNGSGLVQNSSTCLQEPRK